MVNIIINAGHKPYLVDIDKNSLCPSLRELTNLALEKKVNAIIYTHLHGYNINLKNLAQICSKNNILLIEDCAQSLWCKDYFEAIDLPGSYGDAALFSTGFFKNINTFSGGFLLLKNKDLRFKKVIIQHQLLPINIQKDFVYRAIYGLMFKLLTNNLIFSNILFPILKFGFKKNLSFINKRAREENNPVYIKRDSSNIVRMNMIQNFLISQQNIFFIKKDYLKRYRNTEIYLNNLQKTLKSKKIFIPGYIPEDSIINFKYISSFPQLPLICDQIKDLLDLLITNNIDIAPQHIRNLAEYKIYNHSNFNCPIAKVYSRKILLLPTYPEYPEINIHKITLLINRFYNDEKI